MMMKGVLILLLYQWYSNDDIQWTDIDDWTIFY